jgi:8-oxo-dGTP diphosphatase
MKMRIITCPICAQDFEFYDNPKPVVDIIIRMGDGIVLIRRKNPPPGWAIPGGFVDYGETVEQTARREAREETGLELTDLRQFHVYSDPTRDDRGHTISTVFTALGIGTPTAGDDAADFGVFQRGTLPEDIAFDHPAILADYFAQFE